MQLGRIRIRFDRLLEIVTVIFLLNVIGWAVFDTWQGALRAGEMIAILQLAGILMQTIILIVLASMRIQDTAIAMEPSQAQTEADSPAHIHPRRPPVVFFYNLIIQEMAFRFPGRKWLLKDISLHLKKGEIVTLSGDSGQGKSTLLQVLQKSYPYGGGTVRINGIDLESIETPAWHRMIGVVSQDTVVFGGTVLANICLDSATEQIRKVRQFCRDYGFDSYFESLPQSYMTVLGPGGLTLSGGQKQLLALARCLYADPQLLLLDEPTSAMDTKAEQFVISVLQQYRQQAGILIISHKEALTGIADKVFLLEKGRTHEMCVQY